jgi:hypothetical protein
MANALTQAAGEKQSLGNETGIFGAITCGIKGIAGVATLI